MTDYSELHDDPFEVKINAVRDAYVGRVWDVREEDFDYRGEDVTRQFVAHTGAAAVIAIDDAERVLLIQQYRHPIRTRDWEIPAGLLDVDGESPLESAKRELAEEVDLVAERWEPLVSIWTTPGGSDEIVHVFLARGLSPAATVHAREAEEVDILSEWVPIEDAVDAVLAGRMRNGILVSGVLAAVERLRRG